MKHHLNALAGPRTLLRIGQVSFDKLHCFETRQIPPLARNEVINTADRILPPRFSSAAAIERPMNPADPVTRYFVNPLSVRLNTQHKT